MHRNQSVNVHQFAMVPRADIPRSSFRMERTLKTTFDAGYLVPVFCEEVLPGDTWSLGMTAFARMATPIFPVMDNLYLDSFFFFVPCRLLWSNWKKFMGEQANPGDSISYTVPQTTSPTAGYAVGSLYDYFGIPTVGQLDPTSTLRHNVLPMRAYNLIWNEWFRDQNLQNSVPVPLGDGLDTYSDYVLLRRGKRHDYFTGALPFVQKGASVQLPLGTTATVKTNSSALVTGAQSPVLYRDSVSGLATGAGTQGLNASGAGAYFTAGYTATGTVYPSNLYADLSTATAATINQIRQAFQIQKLLERDARGGTRYTELLTAHFGVRSPDARLQRPEYLGGGSNPITVNPVAQTSATGVTGGTTPAGTLAAFGQAVSHNHGFSQSFVEHGYVIGLVNVRADLTYQQGLRKMWSRSTRYDFYFPVFASLGEQAILNKEIYCVGNVSTQDDQVFGYQERWAEYRYLPSQITGLFRSTSAGTIDAWHLSQKFASLPTLNSTFIQDTPPVSRVVAVGASANGQQFLMDAFFQIKAARPMPMYSVPGLVDHF